MHVLQLEWADIHILWVLYNQIKSKKYLMQDYLNANQLAKFAREDTIMKDLHKDTVAKSLARLAELGLIKQELTRRERRIRLSELGHKLGSNIDVIVQHRKKIEDVLSRGQT